MKNKMEETGKKDNRSIKAKTLEEKIKRIVPGVICISFCILLYLLFCLYIIAFDEEREKHFIIEYIASEHRGMFHYSSCIWAEQVKPEDLIIFKNRQEALDSGRTSCKVCKP